MQERFPTRLEGIEIGYVVVRSSASKGFRPALRGLKLLGEARRKGRYLLVSDPP